MPVIYLVNELDDEHPQEVDRTPISLDDFMKRWHPDGFGLVRQQKVEAIVNGNPVWADMDLEDGDRVKLQKWGEIRCPRCNGRIMFRACPCVPLGEMGKPPSDTTLAQNRWMEQRLGFYRKGEKLRTRVSSRAALLMPEPWQEDSGE